MAKKSRKTQQKELLKKIVSNQKAFFTAQEIADQLKNTKQEVGIATIYRFLANQRKTGQLHSFRCKNTTIYSTTQTSHCHFQCEQCGSTKHIDIKKMDFLATQVNGKICHIQIDISGICSKCSKMTDSDINI